MRPGSIFILFCLIILAPGLARSAELSPRGLFVPLLQDQQSMSSTKEMDALINFAQKTRVKILFVQVYRTNQTWFASSVGDQGPYDSSLKTIGEDPLALLIKKAHARGLEVHAWVNLFNLGKNARAPLLKKYGNDILTRNIAKKKSLADYKIDEQYFLEPGDPRVREELNALVGELLNAYTNLDGIQFDHLQYPDKTSLYGYSPVNIERFKKETGQSAILDDSSVWQGWKRGQVTACLEELVKTARSIRPQIQISVIGQVPHRRAYEDGFQDWASWISRGLVDFVTTMNYATTSEEFERYLMDSISASSDFKRICPAIAAHALANSPEIFGEQLRLCEAAHGGPCVISDYSSLLKTPDLASSLSDNAAPSTLTSP